MTTPMHIRQSKRRMDGAIKSFFIVNNRGLSVQDEKDISSIRCLIGPRKSLAKLVPPAQRMAFHGSAMSRQMLSGSLWREMQRHQPAAEDRPKDFCARSKASEDCSGNFRVAVQTPAVTNGKFAHAEAKLRCTGLHLNVPAECAVLQVDATQRIAAKDAQRTEIGKMDLPGQSDQARRKPVSEALHRHQRAGFATAKHA